MIIACPNCKTKYNLPEEKISPDGSKVKCAKCRHVFDVAPPPATPEEEVVGLLEKEAPAVDAPETSEEDFDEAFDQAASEDSPAEEEPSEPEEEPEEGEEPEEDEEEFSDLEEDEDDEEDEEEEEYEDDEDDEEEEEYEDDEEDEDEDDFFGELDDDSDEFSLEDKKKSGNMLGKVLILVVVLGAIGAVFYFKAWTLLPFDSSDLPLVGESSDEPQEDEVKPGESPSEKVKNIALNNVRQYYVTNEKAGPIFVVEGKAVNKFEEAKERIQVEVSLYDEKGNVLESKKILCGNTLSLFQLQVQTQEEIDAGLASEVGVLSNNTYIRTGKAVPFMLVFFDPPENVKEFGVKVIDAKTPTK